jgi:hypothetical protein
MCFAGKARSWYSMHLSRCPLAARATHTAFAFCATTLLRAAALPAAELGVSGIDFAPAVNAKWPEYGEAEAATLRKAIRAAVAREKECAAVPMGVGVNVTVEDLAPTRLTRQQLADNPSLDVVHSKSLGGAELKGEVLDAQQHVLRTVSYRYFAPTITVGSPARDPWADARLAIDGFAAKLAAACRNLQPSGPAGSG